MHGHPKGHLILAPQIGWQVATGETQAVFN